VVPAAIAELGEDDRPDIRHQCGERTLEVARAAYEEHGVDVDLMPFIEDMAEAYAWADLVICRAGALTIAELCAVGVPAVLVPYPAAVDDHQTANAQPLAQAGAAIIVQDSELTPRSLAALLRDWLQSRAALAERAARARALACPDALRRITDICLEQAGATA
jgi:UDP-N-acetylglucosamine--N-acetylmuramyl-(pentapeptide) pyrophosphoryl-undecaprenol N-acetylglucosamine transferase